MVCAETCEKLQELEKRIIALESRRSRPFDPPTREQVRTYCKERKNEVDADKFYDHYVANGWMVGKNKMKDWKAAVRTWEKSPYREGDQKDSDKLSLSRSREELIMALKDKANTSMPQLSMKAKELFFSQGKKWRDLQAEVLAGIISF